MASGENEAARFSPSGPPPLNRTENPNIRRMATSRPTSTARTRAPSSMFMEPSTWTPAMVTSGQQPPGNADSGGGQQAGEGRPVQSVHRRLHGAVGQQRQPCRAGADLASERRRDIGVEGAVGLHLPAHGDEADGEDHNDDADDEVGARGAGTVAERCRQGRGADDSGQRGLRGQDKEEDAQHADAARAQGGGVFLAGTGFCGPGLGIRNTHWILLNGHECWGDVRGRRCPDVCWLLGSAGLRQWAAP